MSSQTITQNDLTTILNQVLPRPAVPFGITGSVTITATATSYTLCSLVLEPNTKYLILSRIQTDKGTTLTLLNQIGITGSYISEMGGDARVTTSAGQGLVNWKYIETGDESVTISLRSYSYADGGTGYKHNGQLLAIPL